MRNGAPDLATSDVTIARSAEGGEGLTTYVGGKNGAGVWQRLISQMPPHRVFVEAFLGSGAIIRRKRPASANIGLDIDPDVIAAHRRVQRQGLFSFRCVDALDWLDRTWDADAFIYCDPPYLGEARAGMQARYKHEMLGEDAHRQLLQILTSTQAMVMISGYAHPLYDQALKDWRRITYTATTRGGVATEIAWMNYPEPTALHDYRYLGRDFHDRCRIKRKISRWSRRLAAMPALERAAVWQALNERSGK